MDIMVQPALQCEDFGISDDEFRMSELTDKDRSDAVVYFLRHQTLTFI